MKKTVLYILVALSAAFAQFPGPPAAYPRVLADTISDTSLVLWQVPKYGGSNTAKLRSMTVEQLRQSMIGQGGNADFDTLSCQTCFFVDSSANYPDSINAIINSGRASNVAPGGTAGYVFGQEYMYHSNSMLAHDSIPKVCLIGNSTVAGASITDSKYLLQNLLKQYALANSKNVNFVNMGVSGTNTKQWIDSLLPMQLDSACDVYMVRYGLNDGTNNRAGFVADYNTGLQMIRNQCDVQECTIMSLTPNSTNVPGTADSTWDLYINQPIRYAARTHQATFIDLYTYFRDAENALGWMDGTTTHIHPLEMENLIIAGVIADVIFPRIMATTIAPTNFINPDSSYLKPASTATINAVNDQSYWMWPEGISMYKAKTGWPYPNGGIFTMRQKNGSVLQFNPNSNGDGVFMRTGIATPLANAWGTWRKIVEADSGTDRIRSTSTINNETGFTASNSTAGTSAAAEYTMENDSGPAQIMLTSSAYTGPYGSTPDQLLIQNWVGGIDFKAGGYNDAARVLKLNTDLTSQFFGPVGVGVAPNSGYSGYTFHVMATTPNIRIASQATTNGLIQYLTFGDPTYDRTQITSTNVGTTGGSILKLLTSASGGSPLTRVSIDENSMTTTVPIVTPAATTAKAGLSLPAGTSPTTCAAGAMWYDGTHFYGCTATGVASQLDN